MTLYALDQKQPQLKGKGHFIAPNATLIGDVELAENSSVWFNAVLRADNDKITIGANSNIQDAAILHVDPGYPLVIHEQVTVGHKAMLHGCTVGGGTLIGMNAVVLNGAVIGQECLIGANALVTENMQVPDGSLVLGSPAKIVKALDIETRANLRAGAKNYVNNAAYFSASLKQLPE